MIEAQFNMFDAVVILVFLLSTLLAFFRGFVREVLSLGAWLGAAVITIYAFEPVSTALKDGGTDAKVAYLLGGLGTYILALLCISIINAVIVRYVKSGSDVGMLDNLLGLGFGALRGAFIISLGYLVLTLVIPDEENPPEWMKEAQTRPVAQKGALFLATIAPGYLEDISSLGEKIRQPAEEDKSVSEAIEEILPEDSKGYSTQQRQLLENMMDPGKYEAEGGR